MNIRYICWLLCLFGVEWMSWIAMTSQHETEKRYCYLVPTTSCFWSVETSIFISPATTIFSIYPMNFSSFNANGIFWRHALTRRSHRASECRCQWKWLMEMHGITNHHGFGIQMTWNKASMCSRTHKCIVIHLAIVTEYASTELYYWVHLHPPWWRNLQRTPIADRWIKRKNQFWRKFVAESVRRRILIEKLKSKLFSFCCEKQNDKSTNK